MTGATQPDKILVLLETELRPTEVKLDAPPKLFPGYTLFKQSSWLDLLWY